MTIQQVKWQARSLACLTSTKSKENGKHTLRAMRGNARRGYLNGSKPPYGYRAVEVDVIGCKGKKKKAIDADPHGEAEIVKRIYEFYLHGSEKEA